MAGVFFEYDFDSERLERLFTVLVDMAHVDALPLFQEIGEIVMTSVQENFEEHHAPDGTPWEPLSPAYAEWKRRYGQGRSADDILVLNRILMGSIHPEPHRDRVEIGTNVIYAAVHQFGADFSILSTRRRVKIPARPYLPLEEHDLDSVMPEIGDAVFNFIERNLEA